MATRQVNIHEAKAELSKLVNGLAEGDEIVIANRGTPVARLVPFHRENSPRPLGCLSGRVVVDDSTFEALAAAVSDEELDELGWPV